MTDLKQAARERFKTLMGHTISGPIQHAARDVRAGAGLLPARPGGEAWMT